ncbi:MAG: polyprenyl synthetase family protein [Candidatus Omnitrophica bacterium]|nr:polyprenyl synthetase family protein [Candidatus Omnitrophota bacterium]
MFKQLKSEVNKQLRGFVCGPEGRRFFRVMPPILAKSLKDFLLRDGKRIRPILFLAGFLGFSKKKPKGLFTCALSLELLHDFLLIHDDIIDKSSTRRGKPSMHELFNQYIKPYKNIKFSGQDLAILAGDVLYAMAIDTFLSIRIDQAKKEKALANFIKTMALTGSGEFIELILGLKKIDRLTKKDIYKVYDLKTADYTFASPLMTGAILAGAGEKELSSLFDYATNIGRAFQINDDIIGTFGDEKKIGKPTFSDLQEGKMTLLIWHAYNNTGQKEKKYIKNLLSAEKVGQKEIKKIKTIMKKAGSLKFARAESQRLAKKAFFCIKSLEMKTKYKKLLIDYAGKL